MSRIRVRQEPWLNSVSELKVANRRCFRTCAIKECDVLRIGLAIGFMLMSRFVVFKWTMPG